MTTFNWYLNGFNKGYWPGDKNFNVADPHNQYSKDFRQGLVDGELAGKKALDNLVKQSIKEPNLYGIEG